MESSPPAEYRSWLDYVLECTNARPEEFYLASVELADIRLQLKALQLELKLALADRCDSDGLAADIAARAAEAVKELQNWRDNTILTRECTEKIDKIIEMLDWIEG